jgi:hypothetical protein
MIGATGLADAAAQLESRTDEDHPGAQSDDETAVEALRGHWKVTRVAIELELARAD